MDWIKVLNIDLFHERLTKQKYEYMYLFNHKIQQCMQQYHAILKHGKWIQLIFFLGGGGENRKTAVFSQGKKQSIFSFKVKKSQALSLLFHSEKSKAPSFF